MAASDRRALVTGGAGFLARHLTARLVADGWSVRSLDVRPSPVAGVESCVGDVTDAAAVRGACEGVEDVFHLAALLPQRRQPPECMHAVNVGGTRAVLEAAQEAGARAVVLVSSAEVYGVPREVPCPEDAPAAPIGEYGRNKVECERLGREAASAGLHVPVLRPCTIVGPGMPEPLLTRFLRDAKRGRPIVLVGRGGTRFQLVAVSDVVEACVRALDVAEPSGEAFNLGSLDVPTMRETAERARAALGSTSRLVPVPKAVATAAVRALALVGRSPLEPEHLAIALSDYVFDVTKAGRLLGWKPEHDNVAALLSWFSPAP